MVKTMMIVCIQSQWKSLDNGMYFVHPFDDQEIIDNGYSEIAKDQSINGTRYYSSTCEWWWID